GSPYLIHWGNYIIGNGAGSIIYTNTSTIAVGMSYESTTANANPLSFSSGAAILSGSSSPEGAVTAKVGSLYMRSDGSTGTTLYVKESGTGNTGWVAVASGTMSGSAILSALASVDGTGSGLDADLLDGNHASAFATSGHNHSGVYEAVGVAAALVDDLSGVSDASTARTNLGLGSLATLSSVGAGQMAVRTITTVSGTTDTAAADQHMTIRSLTHGTGATVTLPASIAAGVQIDYLAEGAGTYVFDDDGTSTIQPSGTLTIDGQYAWVSAISLGGNAWRLVGALTA
ncbi:MAG: hypothetical protein KDB36_07845, partial [Acidimicrobiales bacterium]|nr:hypothetical protein [Acidimicrobiales bacterium]